MLKQGYLSLTHVVEETSNHVSKQNVFDVIKSQDPLAEIAVQI